MKKTTFKHLAQSLILFTAMFSLSTLSDADEISQTLASHFSDSQDAKFVDYESVEQMYADEYGSMRYLVMDFDVSLATADVQHNIHQICSVVLQDQGLVRQLSDSGYDMISVSFDQQTQYDCL